MSSSKSLLCCIPFACCSKRNKSKERTPLLKIKSVSGKHRSDEYMVKEEVNATEEERMVLDTMGVARQHEKNAEPPHERSTKVEPSRLVTSPDHSQRSSRKTSALSTHVKVKSEEILTHQGSTGSSSSATFTGGANKTPPKNSSTHHKRSSSQAQEIQSPQANRRRIRETSSETEALVENRHRAKSMNQRSNSLDFRRTNIKALVEKWLASSGEDRVDVLHDIYRTYDANADDSITRKQFAHFYKDFYRELFLIPSRAEYREMVDSLDEEHEDDISFKEFRKNFDKCVLPSVHQKIKKRAHVRKLFANFFASPPERDSNGFSEEEATIFRFYTEDDDSKCLRREGFSVLVAEACTVLNIPLEAYEDEMLRDFTNKAFEELKDLPRKDQRIEYHRFSTVFNDYVLPRLYAIMIRTFKSERARDDDGTSDTDSEMSATPYSMERSSMPSENAMRLREMQKTFMPPSLRRGKSILFKNYVFETDAAKQRDILMRLFQSFDTDGDGVLSRRELGIFLLSLFDNFGMKDDLSKEDVVHTYELLSDEAFGGVRFEDFELWWGSLLSNFQAGRQHR
mmetsp:Transcript_4370/g.16460  ORF Transcript_4370/g.16460 Transcript_4370/m.16460 type:complete len:569 (-) Transcript_4370:60-1766(-)